MVCVLVRPLYGFIHKRFKGQNIVSEYAKYRGEQRCMDRKNTVLGTHKHTHSLARPLGRSHTMMNKGVSRTVHIIVVNGLKTRSSSIKCINLFAMENGTKVKIKIWANIIFRIEWTVSYYYTFTKEENEAKNCQQNGYERSQWSQAVQHRRAYKYTTHIHSVNIVCVHTCVWL